MRPIGKTLVALCFSYFFIFSFIQVSAQCPSGDVILTSQADVEWYGMSYPNCTEISGNLFLGSFTSTTSDISDLSALNNVEKLLVGLTVSNCDLLTDLDGLNHLGQINGDINFSNNDNLTGFTDLASVIGSVQSINIVSNNSISTLSGLGNISLTGGLNIQSHQNLTALMGLGALGTLTSLNIKNNNKLTNISALGGLEVAHIVKIEDNQILASLLGLGDLTTITQDLVITNNPLLADLGSLSNLAIVGKELRLDDLPALTKLTGFESLTSQVKLIIKNNDNLSAIGAWSNINNISAITIQDNPKLANLQGLNAVQNIASINIINNNSLINLQGLNGLRTISSFFQVYNNGNLETLEGLEGVGNITGIVSIIGNSELTTLLAIDQTVLEGSKLYLYENHKLPLCNVNAVCQYLTDYPGKSVIFNNDDDCQTLTMVENTCGLALPVEFIRFNVSQVEDRAKLVWSTAYEANNLGFEIERSTDGFNWAAIGFEKGKGRASDYILFDKKPKSGKNYYRLQQIDLDGQRTTSPIKQLNFVSIISELTTYPNPTRDQVTIELPTDRFLDTDLIKLFNLTGTMLRSWTLENNKTQVLDLQGLPSGQYVLYIDDLRQMLVVNDGK